MVLSDTEYLERLNDQIAKHPTSFAGRVTPRTLALHREAWPFDLHFDPISARFMFNVPFSAETFEPDLSAWQNRVFWHVMRRAIPLGENRPFVGHANEADFELAFGGGIACGHANPQNFSMTLFGDPWPRILAEHANLTAVATANPAFRLCATPDAVRRAKREGKRALVFGVEGAHCLGKLPRPWHEQGCETSRQARLNNLRTLKRTCHAAYLTLDHYAATDYSRSSIATNIGSPWFVDTHTLTPAGEALVTEAFDLGLMIDLSHSVTPSILRVCAMASQRRIPVIASHAGSTTIMRGLHGRATTQTRRMLSDASIHAIARTGGCIGVIIGTQFLTNQRVSPFKRVADAPLSVFLEHYEKLANLIARGGVADPWDHLAFGTDFDGGLSSIPWELDGAFYLPLLTLAMTERGWPEERIKKVYSGNFLRVWDAALAAAG